MSNSSHYFYVYFVPFLSIGLGVIVCLLPNLVLANVFLKNFRTKSFIASPQTLPRQILTRFYLGEILKLLLTTLLFVLIFQWKSLEPLYFFGGFIVTQLGYWYALNRSKGMNHVLRTSEVAKK